MKPIKYFTSAVLYNLLAHLLREDGSLILNGLHGKILERNIVSYKVWFMRSNPRRPQRRKCRKQF